MDDGRLAEIEKWCIASFEGSDAARKEAYDRLKRLTSGVESMRDCQAVLDKSKSHYALTVAANSITQVVTDHWGKLSAKDHKQIRDYVLNYLGRRGPTLKRHVLMALVQILVRVTKLGWFEEGEAMRETVKQVTKFLEATVDHCVIGLVILKELVSEMNHKAKSRSITQHRKIAVSFRNVALLQVFEIALSLLLQVATRKIRLENADLESNLLGLALDLAIQCLNFDFIGTDPGSASEDLTTVHAPATWRERIENFSMMDLLFALYRGCCTGRIAYDPFAREEQSKEDAGTGGGNFLSGGLLGGGGGGGGGGGSHREVEELPFIASPVHSAKVLNLIGMVVSIRRSLFSADEIRKKFVDIVVSGLANILDDKMGMSNKGCYHEFCVILARLKSNYQLGDIVASRDYGKFIELVAAFSVHSFQGKNWSSNCVHYILGLWSRFVQAIAFMSGTGDVVDHRIDTLAPKVVEAYVKGRLDSVIPALSGAINNDLMERSKIEDEIAVLPEICKIKYDTVAAGILNILDPLLDRYDTVVSVFREEATEERRRNLLVTEHQIAWLVYIIAGLVGQTSNASPYGRYIKKTEAGEGFENIDADLIRRVLQLMDKCDTQLSSSRGHEKVDARLEFAILHFLSCLRKAYLSEMSGMPSVEPVAYTSIAMSTKQKSFKKMFDRLGMGSHVKVAGQIVRKLANNFRFWGDDTEILERTLKNFSEMSHSYSSARMLLTLDAVKYLLTHHTEENFPFLKPPENTRLRTLFYTGLARLLFIDEDGERFEQFMEPLLITAEKLSGAIERKIRSGEVARTLIGLCRDLRGIVIGATQRRTYIQLFDVIYPKVIVTLIRAMGVWFDSPHVTSPLLKFFSELVWNKGSRIVFETTSPNGILLFRETAKLLVSYGTPILSFKPPSEPYKMKFKGIAICMRILQRALEGNYVNFGVFALYKDKALPNALEIGLKLALCIPLSDVHGYTKVKIPYYDLMNSLFRTHMDTLTSLPPPMFGRLLRALKEGLTSIDSEVTTLASHAVDNLASYFVRNIRKKTPTMGRLNAHLREKPSIFSEFRTLIFQIFLFGDNVQNVWSLANPVLALILADEIVHPKSFDDFTHQVVSSQPNPEVQDKVAKAFKDLMKDVSRTLDRVNKDRFNRAFSVFRHDLKGVVQM